jgi:hypothetical protein
MSKGADAETAEIVSYLYLDIPAIGIPATLVNPPTSTVFVTETTMHTIK